PQPAISRHLKILRERGMVTANRDGQTITYTLTDRRIVQALDLLRGMLSDTLKDRAELAERAHNLIEEI
ncbi:MAG: ArsR family transcriptional regulator, partial [Anaerolineaceae bacterium]